MGIIFKLQTATTTDLYNISILSAKAKGKELLIYENNHTPGV